MEDFTDVAFWLIISLLSINVIFVWLTVNDGAMALTTSPDSVMASNTCYNKTVESSVNIVTEGTPNNPVQTAVDFSNSQVCTVNSLWVFSGGWQIALSNVFSGSIFGNPNVCDSENGCSLGWLYLNFIMPVLIVAQIIAMFLIFYRVAIAAKGLLGAAVGL